MLRIEGKRSSRYCDGLSRRSFVQLGVAGMASVGSAARLAGQGSFQRAGSQRKRHLGHPALARRRARPHGHVRHEARGPGRIPRASGTRSAPTCRASKSPSCFRCRPRSPTSSRSSARCTTTTATTSPAATTCSPVARRRQRRRHRRQVPVDRLDRHQGAAARESRACRPTWPCPTPPASACGPAISAPIIWASRTIRSRPTATRTPTNFQVQNIQLPGALTIDRLEDRQGLLQHFDRLRRDVDTPGTMDDDGPLRAAGLSTWSPARRPARRSTSSSEDPELARPLRPQHLGPEHAAWPGGWSRPARRSSPSTSAAGTITGT